MGSFLKRFLVTYFLRGLLVVVPLAIVIVVLWRTFQWLDGLIKFDMPGLGLAAVFGIIIGAGFLASTFLFRPFEEIGNSILDRLPILKKLYGAIKDVVEALVGSKRSFDKPVLVKVSATSNLEKPGFITNEALDKLGLENGKVAVYMPHSFAWSGNIYIVPAEHVTPVNMKAGDMMTFIVSAGVVESDEKNT